MPHIDDFWDDIVDEGLADPDQAGRARARFIQVGGGLDTAVLENSALTADDRQRLLEFAANALGKKVVDPLSLAEPDREAARHIPRSLVDRYGVMPARDRRGRLILITPPLAPHVFNELKARLGRSFDARIALEIDLRLALARHFDVPLPSRFDVLRSGRQPGRSALSGVTAKRASTQDRIAQPSPARSEPRIKGARAITRTPAPSSPPSTAAPRDWLRPASSRLRKARSPDALFELLADAGEEALDGRFYLITLDGGVLRCVGGSGLSGGEGPMLTPTANSRIDHAVRIGSSRLEDWRYDQDLTALYTALGRSRPAQVLIEPIRDGLEIVGVFVGDNGPAGIDRNLVGTIRRWLSRISMRIVDLRHSVAPAPVAPPRVSPAQGLPAVDAPGRAPTPTPAAGMPIADPFTPPAEDAVFARSRARRRGGAQELAALAEAARTAQATANEGLAGDSFEMLPPVPAHPVEPAPKTPPAPTPNSAPEPEQATLDRVPVEPPPPPTDLAAIRFDEAETTSPAPAAAGSRLDDIDTTVPGPAESIGGDPLAGFLSDPEIEAVGDVLVAEQPPPEPEPAPRRQVRPDVARPVGQSIFAAVTPEAGGGVAGPRPTMPARPKVIDPISAPPTDPAESGESAARPGPTVNLRGVEAPAGPIEPASLDMLDEARALASEAASARPVPELALPAVEAPRPARPRSRSTLDLKGPPPVEAPADPPAPEADPETWAARKTVNLRPGTPAASVEEVLELDDADVIEVTELAADGSMEVREDDVVEAIIVEPRAPAMPATPPPPPHAAIAGGPEPFDAMADTQSLTSLDESVDEPAVGGLPAPTPSPLGADSAAPEAVEGPSSAAPVAEPPDDAGAVAAAVADAENDAHADDAEPAPDMAAAAPEVDGDDASDAPAPVDEDEADAVPDPEAETLEAPAVEALMHAAGAKPDGELPASTQALAADDDAEAGEDETSAAPEPAEPAEADAAESEAAESDSADMSELEPDDAEAAKPDADAVPPAHDDAEPSEPAVDADAIPSEVDADAASPKVDAVDVEAAGPEGDTDAAESDAPTPPVAVIETEEPVAEAVGVDAGADDPAEPESEAEPEAAAPEAPAEPDAAEGAAAPAVADAVVEPEPDAVDAEPDATDAEPVPVDAEPAAVETVDVEPDTADVEPEAPATEAEPEALATEAEPEALAAEPEALAADVEAEALAADVEAEAAAEALPTSASPATDEPVQPAVDAETSDAGPVPTGTDPDEGERVEEAAAASAETPAPSSAAPVEAPPVDDPLSVEPAPVNDEGGLDLDLDDLDDFDLDDDDDLGDLDLNLGSSPPDPGTLDGIEALDFDGTDEDGLDLDLDLGLEPPPSSSSPAPPPPPPPDPEVLAEAVAALGGDKDEAAELAAEVLLGAGEAGLDALFEVFPGPLVVDRYASGDSVPVTEHGPVLAVIARFEAAAGPHLARRCDALAPDVRYDAVLMFSAVRDPASLPAITAALTDKDPTVRAVAARVAESYRSDEVFRVLVMHLVSIVEHGRLSDRRVAAEALGQLHAAGGAAALIAMLNASQTPLRDAAHRALVEIARQDFGSDIWRWRTFFERNERRPRVEWLIDGLLSEHRHIRLGAFRELRRITHQNYGYLPDAPAAARRASAERWTRWWQQTGRSRFGDYR